MFRSALLALLIAVATAHAHYHMLFPNKHSVKADEEVTFTYQFGHPFEHELFDTAEPENVIVIHPDGTDGSLKKGVKKVEVVGAEGKKVAAYQFTFTPPKRGDYTFVAVSPKVKRDGEKTVRDVVKVILHVQTQNGWDQTGAVAYAPFSLDLLPLTRPYGLAPGTAFHVEVEAPTPAYKHKAWVRGKVEVEKYNPTPPKALPPDEQVTRTARTSKSGEAVVTLDSAGWWGITAVDATTSSEDRVTLWVHVDEKAK